MRLDHSLKKDCLDIENIKPECKEKCSENSLNNSILLESTVSDDNKFHDAEPRRLSAEYQ